MTDLEIWVTGNEQFLISGGMDQRIKVWRLQPPFDQVYSSDDLQQPIISLCCTTDGADNPVLLVGHDVRDMH